MTTNDRPVSAFAKLIPKAWPHRYEATMVVDQLIGGVPSSPRVIEGWLRTKLGDTGEDILRQQVEEVLAERVGKLKEPPTGDAALRLEADARDEVIARTNLNGFKRLPTGQLYIEGRQLKACIKEAANVARATGRLPDRWGATKKGILAYVAEHIMVVEDVLPLTSWEGDAPVLEPTGILQRFVHTHRGSSIQYEEFVERAVVRFTVITDHPFTDAEWGHLWLTGELQGIGASRSQSYGRFTITEWRKA